MKHKFMFIILLLLATFLLNSNIALAITMLHSLEFTNLENSNVKGTARISHSIKKDGLHHVSIRVKLENLQTLQNIPYKGWLVDKDADYKLFLGAFIINKAGRDIFTFRQKIANFDIYDTLLITRESINSISPYPDKPILTVEIPNSERSQTTRQLMTYLNNQQENPLTNFPATSSGSFKINTQQNTVSYKIQFENLQGTETEAHIHGPALREQNAPILYSLPLGNQKIGIWNYPEEQEQNIINGLTYFNIHSNIYSDSEIRGQIELTSNYNYASSQDVTTLPTIYSYPIISGTYTTHITPINGTSIASTENTPLTNYLPPVAYAPPASNTLTNTGTTIVNPGATSYAVTYTTSSASAAGGGGRYIMSSTT